MTNFTNDLYYIVNEIRAEHDHQVSRWGPDLDKTDDENNMPNDFVTYIAYYSTRWFMGEFPPYDDRTLRAFRTSMVKVATLAIAAIRWTDRKNRPQVARWTV